MAKAIKLVATHAISRGSGEGATTINPGENFSESDEKEAKWLLDNGAAQLPGNDQESEVEPESQAASGAPA